MAVNYAQGLSEYDNKGVCGLPEIEDNEETIQHNVKQLADWFRESQKIVVLVGAGISTSCNIPDFRGPQGVWTKELNNEPVSLTSDDLNFKNIKPSFTHFALSKLIEQNHIQLIISQNVDGLFLRTGLTKRHLSEMHEECNTCLRRFIRNEPTTTMGLKLSSQKCFKKEGKPCRGVLRDTILDWEDELPAFELNRAEEFCSKADLVICLGTSLQIQPVNKLPFMCKKRKTEKGKVVILNLQKTVMDKKADLVIHGRVDDLMRRLVNMFDVKVDDYNEDRDLIVTSKLGTLYS